MDKLKFEAKHLICVECHRPFAWTSGEQAFYFGKGLATPKRCQSCRKLRKATLQVEVHNG